VKKNSHLIRGGGYYQARHGDNWETVAKRKYGGKKFSREFSRANGDPRGGLSELSNGTYYSLPYIDISNSLGLSSHDIEKKYIVADKKSIEPTLTDLIGKLSLIEDEVLPLLRMVYDSAQLTLNHEHQNEEKNGVMQEWDGATITEYEFPTNSLYGLGLKLKSQTRDVLLVSAELIHVMNTDTKERIHISGEYSYLPWAIDNRQRTYEAQGIGPGKEKELIVICWNRAEHEYWFPTEPLEESKRSRNVVVDKLSPIRIVDNRTLLIGSNFYFEIRFNALDLEPFIYKGYYTRKSDKVSIRAE